MMMAMMMEFNVVAFKIQALCSCVVVMMELKWWRWRWRCGV
jgi:hypothetical protein